MNGEENMQGEKPSRVHSSIDQQLIGKSINRLIALFLSILFGLLAPTVFATSVGTIPGTFKVDSAGAATYRMPLTLPPGVAGLTPQIGIDYNSQSPDTDMGPGFSISGLSQITRCPSDFADDGALYGINFNANDRFCLDGKRLNTNTTYGAVGAYYRTEIETFSEVESIGGSPGLPQHWVVKTRSGLTMYYGLSSASQLTQNGNENKIIAWLLEQTVDSSGNHIDYTWTVPSGAGSYYISEIDYGGNLNQSTPNTLSLIFGYAAVTGFHPTGYLDGQYLNWNQLLQNIQSRVNGTPSRAWQITFSPGSSSTISPNLRQVPQSISECTSTSCFPRHQL